jgi:hypothetical protein
MYMYIENVIKNNHDTIAKVSPKNSGTTFF